VRLVLIGDEGKLDLQPCGGTHVKSTGEIGPIAVDKIQNKGKINRRIRLVLATTVMQHDQPRLNRMACAPPERP
jgi:misacylated tRNA(Ala) deacylase